MQEDHVCAWTDARPREQLSSSNINMVQIADLGGLSIGAWAELSGASLRTSLQLSSRRYGTATGKNKVRRYTKVEGTTVTTVVQTLYSVLYRSLKLLGSLTKGCCYSYKYKS